MTVKMPKAGLFDANGKLTAAGHKYLVDLGLQASGGGGSGGFSTDDEPVYIEIPQDGTYLIVASRNFAGTIDSVSTKTKSGTCTLTVLVNGDPIGGSSNSASTTLQTTTHEAEFAEASAWSLSVSFNAACLGLAVTIGYTRTS